MDIPNVSYSSPIGWKWTTLGEMAQTIQYGYTEKANESPVGPKFLRITDIQGGQVNWNEVPFVRINEENRIKYLLRPGDLVFARTGATVGKSFLLTGQIPEAVFASYLIRLRLYYELSEKFVYTFFQSRSYWEQIEHSKLGIGQPNVNGTTLAKLIIPLPPLPEQHRIVAKIEELFSDLDAGVAALQKVKAELKRYRQAVLKAAIEGKLTEEWRRRRPADYESTARLLERIKSERAKNGKSKKLPPIDRSDSRQERSGMTLLPELPEGWEWTSVSEISESMKNGIYKEKQFYNDDGVACLRMYNIENGAIIWKDIKRMKLTAAEIKEYSLNPGDVLVNRVNSRELVGKAAPIPNGLEPCVYESKNIRLRLWPGLMQSNYVGYCFQVFSQQYFNFNAQQVVGMASINQRQVGAMPIPLAPLLEQEQIVSEVELRLSAADEAEKTVEASLKQAERLRQSILKKAFEGKLVPQDPSDPPASELLENVKRNRRIEEEVIKNSNRKTRNGIKIEKKRH